MAGRRDTLYVGAVVSDICGLVCLKSKMSAVEFVVVPTFKGIQPKNNRDSLS